MTELRLDREGPIATLTLASPERRNALRIVDLAELRRHCAILAEDADLRAVVFAAEGERVFSAGVAFEDALDGDWSVNHLGETASAIAALPVPVIAALTGSVHGGAAELVAACDFRLGMPGTSLTIPPAKLGLHYELEGLSRIAGLLGLQAARRLFVGAETLDAETCLRFGFLDSIHAPETFADALAAKLDALTGLAPLAVRALKATLTEIADGRPDPAASTERLAACRASEDFREGVAAIREKRRAQFKGR